MAKSPVTTITPDPLAWAEALRLAGSDPRRLRTLARDTVIVLNHANARPRVWKPSAAQIRDRDGQ